MRIITAVGLLILVVGAVPVVLLGFQLLTPPHADSLLAPYIAATMVMFVGVAVAIVSARRPLYSM